jgi:hypothetical protein
VTGLAGNLHPFPMLHPRPGKIIAQLYNFIFFKHWFLYTLLLLSEGKDWYTAIILAKVNFTSVKMRGCSHACEGELTLPQDGVGNAGYLHTVERLL